VRSARRAHAAIVLAAGLLAAAPGASGAPAPPDSAPSGREVMERAVQALYYPGRDMRAEIRMEIVERSGVRHLRTMTALRLNLANGEQRYLIYFHKPGDVRRMTCMVNKYVGRPDTRWMFVPLANRVRRVTAPERSNFLGSDFVREEFSGRDAAADSHTVVRMEPLHGRLCYVVESVPREPGTEYTLCTSWIDAKNFLPLRQEFRGDKGQILRVYTADRVKDIRAPGGAVYPTPVVRTMTTGAGAHWTRMTWDPVEYDVGLKESDFSQDHMREPMDTWLKEPGSKGKPKR
jgi:hypothetical protein